MSDKKFGLIIPKKTEKLKKISKSIFDDESEDDDKESKRPKIPQKKMNTKTKIKQESLEDPSIYEYDSIYDDMKAKQAESIAPKEKKNSRYIDTLLKAADKRKKEYERRIDKKIQAEREKEGDMYEDKEAFVTSSYKKKLQEKEEEEERERRENMMNDMMDVTKQKDLSGFYRHFLNQTIGEEKVPVFGEKYIKQEAISNNENSKDKKDVDYSNIDEDSDGVEIGSDSDNNKSSSGEEVNLKHKSKKNATLSGKSESKRKKYKYHYQNTTKVSENLKDKKVVANSIDQDSDGIEIDSDKNENSSGEEVNLKLNSPKNKESQRKKCKSYCRNTSKISENLKGKKNVDQDSDGIEIDSDSDNSNSGEERSHEKNLTTILKVSDGKDVNLKLKPPKNKAMADKSDHLPKRKKSHIPNMSKTSDSESSVDDNGSPSDKHGSKEIKSRRTRHDSLSSNDSETNKKTEHKEQIDIKKNDCNRTAKIFAKRTVDDLFVASQARYFQRKALRNN